MNFVDMPEMIKKHAQAKANRVHLEHFRKVKLAQLKQQCDAKSNADREDWARTQPEYIAVLDGLKEATEIESITYWNLTLFEMRFDHWRSKEATKRAEIKIL